MLGVPGPIRIGLGAFGAGRRRGRGSTRDPARLGSGRARIGVGEGPGTTTVEAQCLRERALEIRELGGGGRDPLGRVGFSPVVECERPSC